MKVSHRWLLDMVPGLDVDPEEMAARLALRGAPVDEIVHTAAGLDDIVVARVLEAGPHPNADRLSLCRVDGGDGERQVVCGAPNVRAGGWYPFAPVGSTLPGDLRIKKAKIRGEVSEGMLCSAKELGLGDDHRGILELEGSFEPGQPFVAALGLDDATLDVEVTANRGDLLSHLGIARELASDGEPVLPPIPGDPGVELDYRVDPREATVDGIGVTIEDPDLCHGFLATVIRGVQVGPSPAWLQERLRGAGARPINNVVDATNYVMLEMGHPLHAYDLHRLAGKSIVVRRPREGETTLVTLDGEERTLGEDMLLICDAEQPVGLGGIMGGRDSEVEDDTTDILLEAALFDPKSVRATRRALGMSTDASYRFERGVDPEGRHAAVERAVGVILATAGGTVDGPVREVEAQWFDPPVIWLRLARLQRLLGVRFSVERVRELLTPLGFDVEYWSDEGMEVRVPGFRSHDVTREVDLVEEVARAHGYDEFPATLGPYAPNTVPDHPLFALEDDLRDALVGRGFLEAQTPAFTSPEGGDVAIANPLSAREPRLRRSALPAVVGRVEHNLARGVRDVRLFELATSFQAVGPGERPVERPHLALAATGRRHPPHWASAAEALDAWDLKGWLGDVAVLAWPAAGVRVVPAGDVDADDLEGSPALRSLLAGARPEADGGAALVDADAAWVVVVDRDGAAHDPPGDVAAEIVGVGGRIAPGALDVPPWADEVWGLVLMLPREPAAPVPPVHQPLPQHPGVSRDLAFVVPAGVRVGEVVAGARDLAGELLEGVDVFDVYEGDELGRGVRSVALRLRFQAPDRTLKDAEVDRVVRKVIARLEEGLGVRHRG